MAIRSSGRLYFYHPRENSRAKRMARARMFDEVVKELARRNAPTDKQKTNTIARLLGMTDTKPEGK